MRVSVVIPLYNKKPYVRRAIQSVVSQSHQAFECIVIDDGSSDGSAEQLTSFRDSRLKVIRQANAGECAARNRGIHEAGQEWIAFLDADDEWKPAFLERVTQFATMRPEVGAVFTNVVRGFALDQPLITEGPREPTVVSDYFAHALKDNSLKMTSSSVMIRKSLLTTIGGFPNGRAAGGDLDTWLRVGLASSVGYVPDVLAIWHFDPQGVCASLPPNANVAHTYLDWLRNGRVPMNRRVTAEQWVARGVLFTLGECAKRRMWRAAIQHYISFPRCIALRPDLLPRCLAKALAGLLHLR